MKKIAIVTDSCACLPAELVEHYGIGIVPVNVIFEDRVYRDGIDLTAAEFYAMLEQAKKLPTTSSPSPGQYLEVFQELSESVEGILCVTISSKVSMMYDSARQGVELAKEAIPQTPIELIDSRTSVMAQGFVALAAARAAASGQSLAEVTEAAEKMVPRVRFAIVLDTLHYLAKGGRIPKAAAWAGSLLSIKPILTFSDASGGEVTMLERPRTKSRALERLIAIMREQVGEGKSVHAALHYGKSPEEAERLKERISREFDCVEIYVTAMTPVIGAHVGPEILGLAFYGD